MTELQTAASNQSISLITALHNSLQVKVATHNDPDYQSAQDSYFSAQAQSFFPACIATPITNAEAAKIVEVLVEGGVKFAVRGGGHSLNAGAANIESGVAINLGALNKVEVNKEQTLVFIGGGAKWSEVYSVLDNLRLATSGGRVVDIGVGGLTTGGVSFFSAREGLVCDNVENYEVVLADRSVVNANRFENRNLWQALKGGSNNFGIVTRFDIRTFSQENFLGGCIVHDISTLDSQLKGFADLLENFDPYAAIMMGISWNQKRNGYSIFNNLEYTKNDTNPKAFKPFLDAKPQYLNTMRISNLADFATEAGRYAAPGLRNQFATTTFGGGLEFLQTVHSIWKSSISSVSSIVGVNWAMTIQPLPIAAMNLSEEVNSLGLSSSSGPLSLFLLSYNWEKIGDDEEITMAAKKLISDIDEAARERGAGSEFKYLNYAAGWQNPLKGYGEEILKKLKGTGEMYDPEDVFQTLCEG
ncbi:hypothetical protein BOTNAR_0221g00020 [Botryotinia narcissicola]|uniref:FAD-binding PCMH-type domain-containing protein n=1 Tax=Botryotinia narcissicola TaxID=278944 RepID=A0A4Z1IAD6_9HELO|nr:hypothetical protein BOTNAR_0221g00020 [Botryotinia narcissicola]